MATESWQERFTSHPERGGVPKSSQLFVERHAACLSSAFLQPVDAAPKAFLFMGAPGSGKTRLKDFFDAVRGAKDYELVNADHYKSKLPEYANGAGASQVHEESSWIARQVRAVAIGRGCSFMNDAVGSNIDKYAALLERLRANSYHVELGCIHWESVEPLLARVVARARAEGRIVPEPVVRQGHQQIPRAFAALNPLVDAAFLFNGLNRTLVWEQVHGKVSVHDQRFVATIEQVLPS
jgi:predicted ABC-type ATPase